MSTFYSVQKVFSLLILFTCLQVVSLAQSPGNNTEVTSFDYPVESCFTYTYQLTTGDNGFITVVTKTFTANNGEIYNAGYVEDAAGNRKGLLQQINHTADIAWTKYFSFADRGITFNHVQQLPDGKLLLAGSSQNIATGVKNVLFTTVNEDGGLVWSTSLVQNGYEAMATCIDSVPGLPTGIGFAAQNGTSIMYGKLTNNGQVAWAKETASLGPGNVVGMGAEYNAS